MKRWLLLLLFSLPLQAQAGTILYSDFMNVMKQITVKIEHNALGQQFIVYKTNVKMGINTAPFLICEAREITDPPGTWDDTGDISLSGLFSMYWALPNSKPANNGNTAWCTQ